MLERYLQSQEAKMKIKKTPTPETPIQTAVTFKDHQNSLLKYLCLISIQTQRLEQCVLPHTSKELGCILKSACDNIRWYIYLAAPHIHTMSIPQSDNCTLIEGALK